MVKRDAQSIRIANSLPQSPAATAPSSEGAKGLGCACGQARQREPRGGRRSLVPSSPVLRPKRRGFTGGTWFRPSDRARPALRCRPAFPQKRPRSRGGSGGHFALGIKAPRRPFCPLSAGGKWTISPQNRFCGGPGNFIDFRQVNCRKSDAGTRRRCPLCGQTAQARRGPRRIKPPFVLRLASL